MIHATNGFTTKAKQAADETVPAHDHDAERGLLGALIRSPERYSEIAGIVRPDDFHDHVHAATFEIISVPCREGRIPDKDLARSIANGHPERVAILSLLEHVYKAEPTGANAAWYANKVREAASARATDLLISQSALELSQGKPPHEVLRRLMNDATTLQAQANPGGARFEGMSWRELMFDETEIEFHVPGIIAAGQKGAIGGPEKRLKTSIGQDLIFSVGMNVDFLGHFPVDYSCPVLHFTGESGKSKTKKLYRRIAAARGLDWREVEPRITTLTDLPRLNVAESIAMLRREIMDREAGLVVLDPLYLMIQGIGNETSNLFSMGEQLGNLNRLVEETNVTILLTHHFAQGKSNHFEVPQLRDFSMSGTAEWCRQWMLVNSRSPWNPQTGEHRLWLAGGGSEGHSYCYGLDVREGNRSDPGGQVWETKVLTMDEVRDGASEAREAAKEEKRTAALEANRVKVIRALTRAREPKTATALAPLAGLSDSKCKEAIASLYDSGEVEPCEIQVGRNNRLVEAIRLKDLTTNDNQ